jgi:hypothetical protein
MPYKLFIDRMESRGRLWGHGNILIRRLMEGTGLRPTPFDERPLLLDAADLFAYSGARAMSNSASRNKAACDQIHQICSPSITRMFWSTEGLTPELKVQLNIP